MFISTRVERAWIALGRSVLAPAPLGRYLTKMTFPAEATSSPAKGWLAFAWTAHRHVHRHAEH
jgi:hypothetical protein